MTSRLVDSTFAEGARLPNYVNGRLLVAEDLATGQSTLRTRDQWVSQAAGAGVVTGLWVEQLSGTSLVVTAGLGYPAAGEPVSLSNAVTLDLSALAPAAPGAGGAATGGGSLAGFGCCADGQSTTGQQPGTDAEAPSGTEVLLLVARPACRLDGTAPLAPPPSTTVSPGCTARWRVSGVEFRAVSLPVPGTVAGRQVTDANRRNLVAHWCFGDEQLADLGKNPFGFDPAYRGLDSLDPADLTPWDVPLAVFAWKGGNELAWVDNWSARRRVTVPDPTPGPWSAVVADLREAEGQARWLQFQAELDRVGKSGGTSHYAGVHFATLPPVGLVPLNSSGLSTFLKALLMQARRTRMSFAATAAASGEAAAAAEDAGSVDEETLARLLETAGEPTPGFDLDTFFAGIARFGGLLQWAHADFALRQSWRATPVPLPASAPGAKGMMLSAGSSLDDEPAVPLLTVYLVWENVSELGRTPYVVFVANQLWLDAPYQRPPFLTDLFGGTAGRKDVSLDIRDRLVGMLR